MAFAPHDPIIEAVISDLRFLSARGALDYTNAPQSETHIGMDRRQILLAHYEAALKEACHLQFQLMVVEEGV